MKKTKRQTSPTLPGVQPGAHAAGHGEQDVSQQVSLHVPVWAAGGDAEGRPAGARLPAGPRPRPAPPHPAGPRQLPPRLRGGLAATPQAPTEAHHERYRYGEKQFICIYMFQYLIFTCTPL